MRHCTILSKILFRIDTPSSPSSKCTPLEAGGREEESEREGDGEKIERRRAEERTNPIYMGW